MKRKRILFSWIGHMDLRGMASSFSVEQREKLHAAVKGLGRHPARENGPLHTLLGLESFDEIHLASNYPAWVKKEFIKWIGRDIQSHDVKITNPSNYREVFSVTNDCLAKIYAGIKPKNSADFHFFLTPGTPTMAAILVLLGKSRFPATFWQTHEGKASTRFYKYGSLICFGDRPVYFQFIGLAV